MTTLIERLRFTASHGVSVWGDLQIEAADEIEQLTLDLHSERAAVVALRAGIAELRESANLRVRFHAAELADMTAERDTWKDTLAQRDREIANAKASGIHSCHADCTRSGCVNGRLRTEMATMKKSWTMLADAAIIFAEHLKPAMSSENAALTMRLREIFEDTRKDTT